MWPHVGPEMTRGEKIEKVMEASKEGSGHLELQCHYYNLINRNTTQWLSGPTEPGAVTAGSVVDTINNIFGVNIATSIFIQTLFCLYFFRKNVIIYCDIFVITMIKNIYVYIFLIINTYF